MAYGAFKNLTIRKVSHKILLDKAFNIAKNPKYDGQKRGLASITYEFFGKEKLLAVVLKIKLFLVKNQQNYHFYKQYFGC